MPPPVSPLVLVAIGVGLVIALRPRRTIAGAAAGVREGAETLLEPTGGVIGDAAFFVARQTGLVDIPEVVEPVRPAGEHETNGIARRVIITNVVSVDDKGALAAAERVCRERPQAAAFARVDCALIAQAWTIAKFATPEMNASRTTLRGGATPLGAQALPII